MEISLNMNVSIQLLCFSRKELCLYLLIIFRTGLCISKKFYSNFEVLSYNSFKFEDKIDFVKKQISSGYSTFKASDRTKVHIVHLAIDCEKSLNVRTMSVVSTDGSHLINRKKVYNNTFEFN